jgi:ribosomal protein S18 acetylase RimI-like enzyme
MEGEQAMEFVTVSADNIEYEHICCAITDKKGETCVSSKKAWLKDRFKEGLVFKRLNARGKAFIEYIPAESAWCPVAANGYMHINCFWVSGQFKGHGYANELLQQCMDDAREKGKFGLTVISSTKKMPFLSDPEYLKYKGFRIADTAKPYYELLFFPFFDAAPIPRFHNCAKEGGTDEKGMVLYYSHQCPFTDKYVQLIQNIALRSGRKITLHKIETAEQAQNAPAPFTTYSFFYNGDFVTNEIFSEKKFELYLDSISGT